MIDQMGFVNKVFIKCTAVNIGSLSNIFDRDMTQSLFIYKVDECGFDFSFSRRNFLMYTHKNSPFIFLLFIMNALTKKYNT